MRWKLVVLPAPLGPMSATVSPSATAKLKSCTARKPPKRLLRLRTTSASAIARRLHRRRGHGRKTLPGVVNEADEAGRPQENDRHQDQAVDGELHAAQAAAEPTLQERRQCLEEDRAQHRSPQSTDAADDRHERRLDRDVE